MRADTVPRLAHFVCGFARSAEPFHLVHYLAIASCLEVAGIHEVHVHCDELPYGFYWDLIRPYVTLHRVDPVPEVSKFEYSDPWVARYSYAHHADFVRLDVLAEHGGLYADLDTLFVAPVPDDLWLGPTVIGREADVMDPATGQARASLSNALLMAEPEARFIEAWRAEIGAALDGSWSAHSCFLAQGLLERMPVAVRVEPQRAFHTFEPSVTGLRRLLVERERDLDGVYSIHLNAHLWWEEQRREFSDVHTMVISERWVRESDSTYAVATRPFLPKHGCF